MYIFRPNWSSSLCTFWMTLVLNTWRSLKISSMVMPDTMTRVSPSMMPLTMSWTWLRPVAVGLFFVAADVPSMLPVRSIAYFESASGLSSGPMVKTAGRENCSFSMVMACRVISKSNGEIEIFACFCHAHTQAFLTILTSSTPPPVITM